VALVVKQDETSNPIDISLFGAEGIVFEAEAVAHLVKQFGWILFHSFQTPDKMPIRTLVLL
jgi:hypothetical protein